MKPGTMNSADLNTRQSKSLHGGNAVSGKKELVQRKSLFKVPQNVYKITRNNINQNRGIPKPLKVGLNNQRPSQAITGMSSGRNQTNKKFLRPQVDMLAARKRMFERALHLGEVSGNNTDGKNLNIKNQNIIQKLNLGCTPKQSALTKVYLKLTESAKKAAKSASLIHNVPTSPFEEEIFAGKHNLNPTSVVDNVHNFKSEIKSNRPINQCRLNMDKQEDSKPTMSTTIPKTAISAVPDNSESENIKNFTGKCALNNILKHCQLYYTKISSITDAITCLDDSFQKIIVGEIGGHVYSKFCEYQRKKLELYREIKMIEEELENAVRQEIDVQAKFQDYMRKKVNLWKEEANLLEEFKSSVTCIIDKYEEEVVKPPEDNNLNEIVKMLTSSILNKNNSEIDKPALRRSNRLLLTPASTETVAKSPRVLRSNSKNTKENDDLVIKRKVKSSEKRSIQRSIYKDLQKSFNLCSPESSF